MEQKPNPMPFAGYNNTQLEAMLHQPDLDPAVQERARKELTRRLRDDLLKTAQNVTDSKRRQEQRGRVWKTSRWLLILAVLMVCVLSVLCLFVLAPPSWVTRLTEFLQPLLNLVHG